ncbi:hypothetical protein BH11CYA1_BH11CYA1_14060 [soil metagenome]
MKSRPKAKFNQNLIRYSQCWEDSELVLDSMAVAEGDTILSIASAGDNTFSLLTAKPKRIIAVDFCQAQLALVALKMAAFRMLTYEELLAFLGITDSSNVSRMATYRRLRSQLSENFRLYFDERPQLIKAGIISTGKLERYFSLFRQFILPIVHSKATVKALFEIRTRMEREEFFNKRWNTFSYQLAFKLFFGSATMALIGREASFFKEASGSLSTFLASAAKAALTEGDPSNNHYLHFILMGVYGNVLPHYLRRENFEIIRANLDKLILVEGSLQSTLDEIPNNSVASFNLSDVFEYMTDAHCESLSHSISRVAKPGARVVYWNMAVDRFANQYDQNLVESFRAIPSLAATKTFFYKRFCLDIAAEGA